MTYYSHASGVPAILTRGVSAQLRSEFDLIQAGFTTAEAADALKADKASPALTGVPTAPTAAAGTSTTQLATTAFVANTAFSTALPAQAGNSGKYVTTDGTNASWTALADPSVGDHCVTVHTANGQGSTNTFTRRYTTTMVSVGTAITYADSATLGASFTVNDTGLYEIFRQDYHNVDAQMGFSINSSQMTTSIASIAVADVGCIGGIRGGIISSISRVMRLSATDVIRPHDQVSINGTGNVVSFSVRKVGA